MTDYQLGFIDAYVELRKGAPAARKAGYSGNRAKQEAYELLQNEEIRNEIAKRFAAQTMTVEQATKDITDIARTRLNDYLKVKKVLKTPTVRKSLQQIINELDAEMEFEAQFAEVAKLSGEELKAHKAEQKQRELQGIRYALELEMNPKAYRDVPGEAEWIEAVNIDLVALSKAKEEGRIKKLKIDADGATTIEMYAADANLKTILEFHGKMVQKHEHSFADLDNLNPDELETLQKLQKRATKQ